MTHGRKLRTAGHLTWWLLAIVIISVIGVTDDVIRHAVILVPIALAAMAGAWLLGRRHGLGKARRQVTRRLTDAQAARQVAELEQLTARPIDAIIASYRLTASRYATVGKVTGRNAREHA